MVIAAFSHLSLRSNLFHWLITYPLWIHCICIKWQTCPFYLFQPKVETCCNFCAVSHYIAAPNSMHLMFLCPTALVCFVLFFRHIKLGSLSAFVTPWAQSLGSLSFIFLITLRGATLSCSVILTVCWPVECSSLHMWGETQQMCRRILLQVSILKWISLVCCTHGLLLWRLYYFCE